MEKEVISDKQGTCIMILFILGSTLVVGLGGESKRDAWISIIVAVLFSLPAVLIYARIIALFPEKDLFDILPLVLGNWIGKFFSILYIWFAFHLGTLVIRNFSEFTGVMILDLTPIVLPMSFFVFLCIWSIKEGMEVIGRWTEFFILTVFFVIGAITLVLSVPKMEFSNIRPVLENGIQPIIKSAFSAFSFPFAETVVFTMCFSGLKGKNSSYKIYIRSLLIGAFIIFLVSVRNVLVMGTDSIMRNYFPSFVALSTIQIGDFIQRLEMVAALVFFFAGFVKVSICLMASCRGIVKIFGKEDYRFIATPVGLLMLSMSSFIYDSTMEMLAWAFTVWPYYAFVFQAILPLIIWIAAEIKVRRMKMP